MSGRHGHDASKAGGNAGVAVAVMQPYYFPYAGYFRLFDAADRFVLFDCVQFPRRGRVHRTEVIGPGGEVEWLTLPLAQQPRDTLIRDLAFAPDARRRMDRELARLPWIGGASGEVADRVRAHVYAPLESVVDHLEDGLNLTASLLGLRGTALRSSTLRIDRELRGQDRVLEIVRQLGGRRYVNAPGGRHLYDHSAFTRAGVALEFLPDFHGEVFQMLPALLTRPVSSVRTDVLGQCGASVDA
jgi:hypothetical protein